MKILIVKLAALGDVLRTTALLRPLRERYPDAELWWLTSEKAKPLFENNPWIDRVLSIEEERSSPLERDFDLVLSMEEDQLAAQRARAACKGELIGVLFEEFLTYTSSSAAYYDMSLLNRAKDGGLDRANELKAANRRTYVDIWLGILNINAQKDSRVTEPILLLSAAERQAAWSALSGKLNDSVLIGLNTGSGRRWTAKQLSVAKTAELAEALHRGLGQQLMLLGGADEAERNAQILKASKVPLIDGGTEHPIRGFAAILDLCRVVITADTLAFHIAMALHKDTVVFVGPTSAAELDSYRCAVKLAPASACRCFYKAACTQPASCLDSIPSDRFVNAAGGFFKL